MELAKLLLKLLYLIVLVVICRVILSTQTPLSGVKLEILSFFIGVLIMYFSFDYVYMFMINSELILRAKEDEDEDEDEDEEETTTSTVSPSILGRTTTEKNEKVHMSNQSVNDFVMDHTHQFMQDAAFASV